MKSGLSSYAGVLMYMMTLPGCNKAIEAVMIDTPNKGRSINLNQPAQTLTLNWHGIDRHDRVVIQQPKTALDLWMIDSKLKDKAGKVDQKGTLLLVHGYRNEKTRMVDIAKRYAEAGYRCFMVDLRGHGQSAGEYITYGVQESQDLIHVLDYLEANQLIVGDFGVWGISMGAATAIQFAAREKRVKTVIAVAPYSSMRAVVPNNLHNFLPYTRWTMKDDQVQKIIDDAGKKAGFDPDDANTLKAIKKTDIPILLIHGNWDAICPIDHSRQMVKVDPDRIKLVETKYVGHLAAHFPQVWANKAGDIDWLNQHLAKSASVDN